MNISINYPSHVKNALAIVTQSQETLLLAQIALTLAAASLPCKPFAGDLEEAVSSIRDTLRNLTVAFAEADAVLSALNTTQPE